MTGAIIPGDGRMRFRTEDSRLRRLEAALSEGTISSTGENGEVVRLTGSGLQLGFELLRIADDAGKTAFDLRPDDLPDDLRREADLWSRAEVRGEHGTAAKAVQELCRAITQKENDNHGR